MTAQDRELWDALVFDAYDHPVPDMSTIDNWMTTLPLHERRTLVIDNRELRDIRICVQSSDESYTGELLAGYDAAWWRRQIDRWTNTRWSGTLEVSDCTDEPQIGWIYVREGESDEGVLARDDIDAVANTWRRADSHGIYQEWVRAQIVFAQDYAQRASATGFEGLLAHELGHVMGFAHVAAASGFVMTANGPRRWPDKESWLSQWAYQVGPNVQYPGLLRPTATAPGDLKGGVKDLVDEALADLQDDSDESNGRQAAESVPALPIAGVLLLAIVLGLLGGRRVRAGRHR